MKMEMTLYFCFLFLFYPLILSTLILSRYNDFGYLMQDTDSLSIAFRLFYYYKYEMMHTNIRCFQHENHFERNYLIFFFFVCHECIDNLKQWKLNTVSDKISIINLFSTKWSEISKNIINDNFSQQTKSITNFNWAIVVVEIN